MVELVDTIDSKSIAELWHVGSTPSVATNNKLLKKGK
jgi:hypothetical protein